MAPRKILVTGGAGFIGSSLVEALLADPTNQVIIIDDLSTGNRRYLPHHIDSSRWHFIQGDVNDRQTVEQVFERFKPDYVFHFAAVVGVERTLKYPVKVLRDIEGIKWLTQAAVQYGVQKMFYASSSEVYGETVEIPQREDTTPINARLPYAAVKNIGEVYLKAYHQAYGLRYTIFRFFNTYGPRQSADFVISRFLKQALTGHPITVHAPGTQTRTFCYIEDTIETILHIFYRNLLDNDVINIGNDEEISMLELARKVRQITHSSVPIQLIPPRREGEVTRRRPDNSRMRRILKRDLIPLDEGIRRILKVWRGEINGTRVAFGLEPAVILHRISATS